MKLIDFIHERTEFGQLTALDEILAAINRESTEPWTADVLLASLCNLGFEAGIWQGKIHIVGLQLCHDYEVVDGKILEVA